MILVFVSEIHVTNPQCKGYCSHLVCLSVEGVRMEIALKIVSE